MEYKNLVFLDTSYHYNMPASVMLPQSTAPRTTAVRFQSLIYKNIDYMDLDSPVDRWWMVKRHPLHNRAIIQSAKLKFNTSIQFYSDRDALEEDKDLEEQFVRVERAHELFRKHAINCDTQGWGIMVKLKHPDTAGRAVYRALTAPECSIVKDAYGEITSFKWQPKGAQEATIFRREDVIYKALDDYEDDKTGTSKLAATWDDSVWWALVTFNMAEYDSRLGNGVHVVKVPMSIPKEEEDKIVSQYENLTGRKWVLNYVDNDPNGTLGTEVTTPAQVDYPVHLDKLLESVASGYGLPVNFFKGAPEGALSSAAENGLAVKDKLEADFDEHVPEMLEFMEKFMGIAPDALPALIDPHIELRTSDMTRAQIRQTEAQAAQVEMNWKSLEEIRADFGLEASPDFVPATQQAMERTAEVMSKVDKGKDKGEEDNEPKQENQRPQSDSFTRFTDSFEVTSVRDKGDEYVLEGPISKVGFFDYGDAGRGIIYRSPRALQAAEQFARGIVYPVGIEHVDGRAGEEVYAARRVGTLSDVKFRDGKLHGKLRVSKPALHEYFKGRGEEDWITPLVESKAPVPISIGSVGSLDNNTQDLLEIRSIVFTRTPRCETHECYVQLAQGS